MKRLGMILLALVMVFTLASCSKKEKNPENNNNNNNPTTEQKPIDAKFAIPAGKQVYLTCVGQSDLEIASNVFKRASSDIVCLEPGTEAPEGKVVVNYDNLITASQANGGVVFLVTGSSNKGLGSAGVDVASEKARAQAFADAADKGDIALFVLHIGGSARRGTLTDPILDVVCPSAAAMLVVSGGNQDAYFTNSAASNNVSLYLYEKAADMVADVKILFNK